MLVIYDIKLNILKTYLSYLKTLTLAFYDIQTTTLN